MAAYIVSLERNGYHLYDAILNFCLSVGQNASDEAVTGIFRQIVSQVVSKFQYDISTALAEAAVFPIWKTILFVEDQDYFHDSKQKLKDEVSLFTLCLYTNFREKIPEATMFECRDMFYSMDTCTVTILKLSLYQGG